MQKTIKKVLSFLQKVFLKPEIERYTNCVKCGKELTGNQRKFCGDVCNNAYWRKQYSDNSKNKFMNIFD